MEIGKESAPIMISESYLFFSLSANKCVCLGQNGMVKHSHSQGLLFSFSKSDSIAK